MTSEIQWVRDVPSDPMMQRQWSREAIPWCTTHDSQRRDGSLCEQQWRSGRGDSIWGKCVFSTGGPDHKWWRDTE